jgi:hypothetical protein
MQESEIQADECYALALPGEALEQPEIIGSSRSCGYGIADVLFPSKPPAVVEAKIVRRLWGGEP